MNFRNAVECIEVTAEDGETIPLVFLILNVHRVRCDPIFGSILIFIVINVILEVHIIRGG